MRSLLLCAAALAVSGCKPDSTKVTMGPFTADRYEIAASDGTKQFCYVFGPETNQPIRLCGDGGPTPDHVGVLFSAITPASDSEFSAKVGPPMDPGYYLLKPISSSRCDAWFLGKLGTREWLAEKRLLAVDTTPDHITHVRVIDPVTRADRQFEAKTTTSEFVLIRAPGDNAVMLVQKNGGEEILLLENPIDNPVLSITSVIDGKSAGNRKLYAAGSIDRLRHNVFQPPTGFYGHVGWTGTKPTYDGAPLGPFEEPKKE